MGRAASRPRSRPQGRTIQASDVAGDVKKESTSSRSNNVLIVFGLLYASYTAFYIGKRNYSSLKSVLENQCIASSSTENTTAASLFGMTPGQSGLLQSGFELSNAAVKLVSGPYIDQTDPAPLLAISTGLIGAVNGLLAVGGVGAVAMFAGSSPALVSVALTAIWSLNGGLQALGWPAVSRLLTETVPKEERGLLYAIMSTSQNVGGALGPWIVGAGRQAASAIGLVGAASANGGKLEFCDVGYGWVGPLLLPAIGLPLLGVLLWVYLPRTQSPAGGQSSKEQPTAQQAAPSMLDAVSDVASDWRQWVVAIAYLLLSVPRSVLADSGLSAMLNVSPGATDVSAGMAVSALEIGGFAGGIGAGLLSDRLFRGNRSLAIAVMLAASAAALPTIFAASHSDAAGIPTLFRLLGLGASWRSTLWWALTGAATCGPHVLLGLLARELAPRAQSTAGGLAKAASLVGASIAGAPVGAFLTHLKDSGMAVDGLGEREALGEAWGAVALACAGCCALAAAMVAYLSAFEHADGTDEGPSSGGRPAGGADEGLSSGGRLAGGADGSQQQSRAAATVQAAGSGTRRGGESGADTKTPRESAGAKSSGSNSSEGQDQTDSQQEQQAAGSPGAETGGHGDTPRKRASQQSAKRRPRSAKRGAAASSKTPRGSSRKSPAARGATRSASRRAASRPRGKRKQQ